MITELPTHWSPRQRFTGCTLFDLVVLSGSVRVKFRTMKKRGRLRIRVRHHQIFMLCVSLFQYLTFPVVPAGSPSRGGDVLYVF